MSKNKVGECSITGCEKTGPLTKEMCHKHYRRLRIYGDPGEPGNRRSKSGSSLKEKLEFHGWDVEDQTGCWITRAWKNPDGYGKMQHNGKKYTTHRVSYTVFRGGIPEGQRVCHSCDVPACINPEHLFLGTQRDNIMDMNAKRRQGSKLTPEEAQDIQQRYDLGEGLKEIYLDFEGKVHFTTVEATALRRSWADLGKYGIQPPTAK